MFADGFALGIIGIALSLAAHELGLSDVWLGLLGGASLAGLFAGALLTGLAADRFGRRPIFALNMLIAGALSLMQFLVASRSELLLLRFAIGFLLGTDYVVSKALLTEFVPRRLRGRILGMLSVAWAGGYACAYAVGFTLTDVGPDAWRIHAARQRGAVPAGAPLAGYHARVAALAGQSWLQGTRRSASSQAKFGRSIRVPGRTVAAAVRAGRWRQLFSARWRFAPGSAAAFFVCQVIPYFARRHVRHASDVGAAHSGRLRGRPHL